MKQEKIRISILLIAIKSILFLFNGCSNPEPPKITLSEDSWHYGEVTLDERPTHDFIIKNEGGNKLIIESVYSSFPGVSLDLTGKEIPSEEEVLLKTIFDPTGYKGEVTKILIIKSNDLENPKTKIEAKINVLRVPNPDIVLSEQAFDLGNFQPGRNSDYSIFYF